MSPEVGTFYNPYFDNFRLAFEGNELLTKPYARVRLRWERHPAAVILDAEIPTPVGMANSASVRLRCNRWHS